MRPIGPILLLLASAACAAPSLWYPQPAAKWEEALPVGNGRMGAMIFGGTAEERIQFNEDTLWLGKPHNYVRVGSADVVPQVRQLLAEGKVKEAQDLARAKMLGDPVRQKAYQPFGDLRLTFPGHEKATNYRRELDLDTAVATTRYDVDGVTYTREVIASYPDNVIAVRLSASRAGALTFTTHLTSPHKDSHMLLLGGGTPSSREASHKLSGQVQPDGLRFEARLHVLVSGGSINVEGNSLRLTGADSVTLFLVAATSFNTWDDISADPGARCADHLAKLEDRDFASLLAAHTADHQRLFRRVNLTLRGPNAGSALAPTSAHEVAASSDPATDPTKIPTNERVNRIRKAGN
ncbi:MAG TPA: glycoside hydrolase family 95 protein, partial [Lacunisphaera sp.]|nr:glycoside hydrolase family 95 protein [Lacunisphaera sp.]